MNQTLRKDPRHRKALLVTLSVASLLVQTIEQAHPAQAAPAVRADRKPKLVMLIAIDQFRYDFLVRFRDQYSAGLGRFLQKGAVFTNANLEHYPTVTAIGHSTMLSGATPALSGIMGNDWFDRESGKEVISISDDTVKPLGGRLKSGASPRRLLVSTVGDELKMSSPHSRVIGLALKDRSAILPAGHMADEAFWYDTASGEFVSSTYYFPNLPAWVRYFNARRLPDQYAGKEIAYIGSAPRKMAQMPQKGDPKLYERIYGSKFGDELLEAFAEEAIRAEQIGQRNATDLLSVSFSSNDVVGHAFGPDSPEVKDISIRTDRLLGKLFDALDRAVGMNNVLAILTSDHGVPPLPEDLEREKMPGAAGSRMPRYLGRLRRPSNGNLAQGNGY